MHGKKQQNERDTENKNEIKHSLMSIITNKTRYCKQFVMCKRKMKKGGHER